MKSIIQQRKECYICGTTYNLHDHHCIYGTSNRKNSEKYGLKVWLCEYHHMLVHSDAQVSLKIKQVAQRKFEETHSRDEFIKVFGKSFL